MVLYGYREPLVRFDSRRFVGRPVPLPLVPVPLPVPPVLLPKGVGEFEREEPPLSSWGTGWGRGCSPPSRSKGWRVAGSLQATLKRRQLVDLFGRALKGSQGSHKGERERAKPPHCLRVEFGVGGGGVPPAEARDGEVASKAEARFETETEGRLFLVGLFKGSQGS